MHLFIDFQCPHTHIIYKFFLRMILNCKMVNEMYGYKKSSPSRCFLSINTDVELTYGAMGRHFLGLIIYGAFPSPLFGDPSKKNTGRFVAFLKALLLLISITYLLSILKKFYYFKSHLSFCAPSLWAIAGPNGAGKHTFKIPFRTSKVKPGKDHFSWFLSL